MENGNGNIEKTRYMYVATVLCQELYLFCSFLVRLLHAGQRGD